MSLFGRSTTTGGTGNDGASIAAMARKRTEERVVDDDEAPMHGRASYASTGTLSQVWSHFRPSEEGQHRQHRRTSNLFGDVNKLRQGSQHDDAADELIEKEQKYTNSLCGRIAKHHYFDNLTMLFICINALAIGYDANYEAVFGKPKNLYEGPMYFIIADNVFALYFSVEIIIRFVAYRRKCDCLHDAWFVFDSGLVILMVLETWLLPAMQGGIELPKMSMLRLARLGRLLRGMRKLPELMLIVKGMVAAVRAVAWTVVLLLLLTFTTSIVFTSEYHQGLQSDEDTGDTVQGTFGSMGKSMFSLLIMGAILDDVTYCTDLIRGSGKTHMIVFFCLYIVVGSFMMMNMLLGILVEVVGNSAEGEARINTEAQFREDVTNILLAMDKDRDTSISKSEFQNIGKTPELRSVLKGMGIEDRHFDVYGQLLFQTEGDEEDEEKTLTYDDITSMILRLGPGTKISTLDFAAMSETMIKSHKRMKERLALVERMVRDVALKRLGHLPHVPSGDLAPAPVYDTSKPSSRRGSWQTSEQGAEAPHSIAHGMLPAELPQLPTEGVLKAPRKAQTDSGLRQLALGGDAVLPSADKMSAVNKPLITVDTIISLTGAPSGHILAELMKRLHVADFAETGVPLALLDEELRSKVLAAAKAAGASRS
eukprot:TRINITY_DN8581_c0_g1_i1.p1 TRINITY_DN8581_c0_g1~~TRINITY_DN8581_c0_g1_i1.p1  ORF type:complete len:652 (-),score=123.46 TRINITY_DN8581_c0_g1_i1:269-2224(-)